MMKSTSLCFSISSVWKFVIKNEMSYPCKSSQPRPGQVGRVVGWLIVAPVAGPVIQGIQASSPPFHTTYLDRFPPQDEKALCPLLQKPRELVDQDALNLVGLFDLDANAHGVDGRLDQDALVLVAGDGQGGQQDFGRTARLDFSVRTQDG